MKRASRYISRRDGAWRLWVRRDHWNGDIWRAVQERLAVETPSKHPRTKKIRPPGAVEPLYLKTFYRTSGVGSLKDLFRRSKAVGCLRETESLAGLGFNVPLAVAAGEERYVHFLRRAFLVTLPVIGCPLPYFLRDHFGAPLRGVSVRRKRESLASLAREIRELHDLGFIHGDLVPGNIFVSPATGGAVRFYFMDNDRTRRYPAWLPHRLWRRNLVQLNRFPLAGISLQDRMRFFHAYLSRDELGRRDRKLVRWLERKTRQRRKECDAVDTSMSFRRLMRWNAPAH